MISIVIPLYNKAHTIKRTLASVLKQTYTEFEVLVVNDGSTDNGLEVVKTFSADNRIQIVEQINQGVSAARNKGVASAKYGYIAFLDGDDEWLPTYLEKMKEAIDLHPNGGMYCCAGLYKVNIEEILDYRIARKYKDKITVVNYFENPHVFSHTSATIVNKEKFLIIGGFVVGMKKNEDFALYYTLALIAPVVYCGYPLSCYYGKVEGQATSLNNNNELEMDVIKRFNLVNKIWEKSDKENKVYEVWLKYELRHIFFGAIKDKDYQLINLFLTHLDQKITELFYKTEVSLIALESLNKLSLAYLLFTKVIWRLNSYPRVGIS